MKVKRGTKGFTLIELLIVVAIIGILAAIAIPAYSGYTAKAKIAGVVHAMGAVKTAMAAYFTEAGAVPAATTAALITTTFGVQPPTQYATFQVFASADQNGTGAIEATIVGVSGDTNGLLITLTPNWNTMVWSWGGTVPGAYLPKS